MGSHRHSENQYVEENPFFANRLIIKSQMIKVFTLVKTSNYKLSELRGKFAELRVILTLITPLIEVEEGLKPRKDCEQV